MGIGERVREVVERFDQFDNWERAYRHLIDLGQALPSLEEKDKSEENLVRGCVSQVWLVPQWRDGRIFFHADSDAAIVKGIVALLLQIYSDATPKEILATRPDFIEEIGLRQQLSPNRASGLASLLKQISLYAVAFEYKEKKD